MQGSYDGFFKPHSRRTPAFNNRPQQQQAYATTAGQRPVNEKKRKRCDDAKSTSTTSTTTKKRPQHPNNASSSIDINKFYSSSALNTSAQYRQNDYGLQSFLFSVPPPLVAKKTPGEAPPNALQAILTTPVKKTSSVAPPSHQSLANTQKTPKVNNAPPFQPNLQWVYDATVLQWAQNCYKTLERGQSDMNIRPCFVLNGPDGNGKAALVKEIIAQCARNGIIPNTLPKPELCFDPGNYNSLGIDYLRTELSRLIDDIRQYKYARDKTPMTANKWKNMLKGVLTSPIAPANTPPPRYAAVLFVRDLDVLYECLGDFYSSDEMDELHEWMTDLLTQKDNRVIVFVTCSSTDHWHVRDLIKKVVKPTHWQHQCPLPSFTQRLRWLKHMATAPASVFLSWQERLAVGVGELLAQHLTDKLFLEAAYKNIGPRLVKAAKPGDIVEFEGCPQPSCMLQWLYMLGWIALDFPAFLLGHNQDLRLGSDQVVFSYTPMFTHRALALLKQSKTQPLDDRKLWWDAVLNHLSLRTVMTQLSHGVWRYADYYERMYGGGNDDLVNKKKTQKYHDKDTMVVPTRMQNAYGLLSQFADTLCQVDVMQQVLWRDDDFETLSSYATQLLDGALASHANRDSRVSHHLTWFDEPKTGKLLKMTKLDQPWW